MSAPVKCSMSQFLARCLEEIGLEGRCGLPLRDLFDMMDPHHDVAYRRYAWQVLCSMEKQLRFHVMRPLDAQKDKNIAIETKSLIDAKIKCTPPRRKRKWKTTLLNSLMDDSSTTKSRVDHEAERTLKRRKHRKQPLIPVIPSMRRIAARKQRRRLSDTDADARDKAEQISPSQMRRHRSINGHQDEIMKISELEKGKVLKEEPEKEEETQLQSMSQQKQSQIDFIDGESDAADDMRWVLRSPRGFRLGEEVDIDHVSYEEAMGSNQNGVLGVVACEELRLKYLGVEDPSSMDTISPQFDLLEIIGRARVRGENAATLTSSNVFGDSRKLHYLLDMLIVSNYVVKNIVHADQRRFNIIHLRRFASQFHPSMISPSATIARLAFPKELITQAIVSIMKARGERTCVLADIGRELGYGKRQQEQLRTFFIQQMADKPDFPLQLFMARCKTSSDFIGRKLWCLCLRDSLSDSPGVSGWRQTSSVTFEEFGPNPIGVGRPTVERGIMEQMFVAIRERKKFGATVPELRDVLGVPTFKLPYKLAQGLISNYKISVEQVVLGKSTMYRMFIPGTTKVDDKVQHALSFNDSLATDSSAGVRVTRAADKYSIPKRLNDDDNDDEPGQPDTMEKAVRGMVRASTFDRRRNYILKRVQKDKVVSLHQLRTGLIVLERVRDVSTVDIRSVRRIVDELIEEKKVTTMDITLPPKQVLQKTHRKVRCAVLNGYQANRDAIREFIKNYEEEYQRKYQANFVDHDNDDYIVVASRWKPRQCDGSSGQGDESREVRDQEVVKYSAMSYKLARIGLIQIQKQSRRLGMFFGIMFKCRAFHLMLWDRIEILEARNAIESCGAATTLGKSSRARSSSDPESLPEILFALKDVLDLLTVKEYIQLVGVIELLTDREEAAVRQVIAKGGSWDSLPQSIVDKLRGCEADRFSRIMRVLLDLRLLEIVHDTSTAGLFNVFQTSADFDSIVSRVAFATLSGGLFKIKRRVHISIKQGSSVLHRLSPECMYAYAPGFSGKSKSDHFYGRVPLEFELNEMANVKAYWKSLRFLSVEGARLGCTQSRDLSSVSIELDGALIQSAPLSDHNIYVLKAWVPHSTSVKNSTARAKAAAGSIQALKRKCSQANVHVGDVSPQKRRKIVQSNKRSMTALMAAVDPTDAGVSMFRKQIGAKKTRRTHKWALNEDLRLIELYLEQLPCRWFVEVPLALQKNDERIAFRTTKLSRTLIAWKEIGKILKKKPIECMLRMGDLLETPTIQAKVEKTKVMVTQNKNPSGEFDEEIAIMRQPRLTALLCRALQVILHERSSYFSAMADMLMSKWKESEVKLVWRYLWLAGIITRTPQAHIGKDQKQRGFQIHSKVFEMKSLKIAHYLLETFCEAAKFLSFVDENVDEATIAEERDRHFEHEIPINMSSGQAAVVLSSIVSGFSRLLPVYAAPSKRSEPDRVLPVKGLAGHLSHRCGGVFPEDFLKEYWTVKSMFGISDAVSMTQNISAMQAFSYCSRRLQAVNYDTNSHALSTWLVNELTEAAGTGRTLEELEKTYAACGLAKKSECCTLASVLIHHEVDKMIRDDQVLEVNGYDRNRFVLREFSDLWTLHPYRITSDSTEEKVHFLFDNDVTIVARPWFLLDGSINLSVALKLKRKVVNIVMCCPGIQDDAVHKKMRKLMSLHDMRSLLEELMMSGILYARVYRDYSPPVTNVFGIPTSSADHNVDVIALLPGELRYVDFSRDRLHYFPSVNCMELLGAEACDADLG
ncbi:hypothetical protein PsorP6_000397 [Peronosclerospora sorghi]|uniref:Uncharacterized protein n=1 Tax=Peronosclerospora sorghi TaxID=230839 RepID=A0ACC0WRU6_9STRA|nr:hypothetical protein PsorP6_000397 [Peronosclerospora sorghi]